MLEPENPKLAAFDDEARGERDLTPYYYQTQYAKRLTDVTAELTEAAAERLRRWVRYEQLEAIRRRGTNAGRPRRRPTGHTALQGTRR